MGGRCPGAGAASSALRRGSGGGRSGSRSLLRCLSRRYPGRAFFFAGAEGTDAVRRAGPLILGAAAETGDEGGLKSQAESKEEPKTARS